jgi:anion-transporting  ArsA/GET3 family ATPase
MAPAADPHVLLDRRLLLVTGKGGVGKSTIAATLGLANARRGRRTLLLGVDTIQPLLAFFGREGDGAEPIELHPGLTCLNLDRQVVLDDFVREKVGVKAVARRILRNPVYRYVSAVAPGVRELLVMLRIYHAVREGWPGGEPWDRVIVDAPATGHGVRFFAVPRMAVRTFRVGPLRAMSKRVQALLEDGEQTAVCIVTLAEELPISETIELYERLVGELAIHVAAILVNAVFPRSAAELLDEGDVAAAPAADPFVSRLVKAARFAKQRREINDRFIEILSRGVDAPLYELPYLAELPFDVRTLELIAGILFGGEAEGDAGPGEG